MQSDLGCQVALWVFILHLVIFCSISPLNIPRFIIMPVVYLKGAFRARAQKSVHHWSHFGALITIDKSWKW